VEQVEAEGNLPSISNLEWSSAALRDGPGSLGDGIPGPRPGMGSGIDPGFGSRRLSELPGRSNSSPEGLAGIFPVSGSNNRSSSVFGFPEAGFSGAAAGPGSRRSSSVFGFAGALGAGVASGVFSGAAAGVANGSDFLAVEAGVAGAGVATGLFSWPETSAVPIAEARRIITQNAATRGGSGGFISGKIQIQAASSSIK
jgi:hypothetical protein